jgi:hypothetical protein
MRKCFLHIGTHKTGTTSLQAMLAARYDELQQHGFLYPRAGRGPTAAHHNIAMELSGATRFRSDLGTIEDLINEIDGTQNHIVLSSEEFCSTAYQPEFMDFVARLQQSGLDVSLVVYFRNQIDFMRSAYFEFLKDGSELTLNEFLPAVLANPVSSRPGSIFYHQLLDCLSEMKNAHLLVYSYDEIQQGSVIPHFLSILGLTPQALGADPGLRLNTETPMEEQFKRFYENRVERPLNQREVSLIDCIFEDMKAESIDLSARTKNAIIEACTETNNSICANYGVPNFQRMRPVKRLPKQEICLEDIFSAEAQFFVHDLARTLSGELSSGAEPVHGTAVEKANLARLHHNLMSRHQAFARAFDRATAADSSFADRKIQPEPFPRRPDRLIGNYPLAVSYNGLIAEYDALARGYTDLLAERETLLGAYNRLIAEYDPLARGYTDLLAERETVLGAHNRLIAEYDPLARGYTDLLAERETFLGAHNGLIAEYDKLARGYTDLLAEREALLGAYNGWLAERNGLLGVHSGTIARHDTLLGVYNALIAEHDALRGAHERLIAERDSLEQGYKKATDDLARAVHQASVERDAMQSRLDSAIGERDALLASHSWRLTAPIRALRRLLARYLRGA